MTPVDRLIILALCGAWLAPRVWQAVRDTCALVRHLRRPRFVHIVGAPYDGPPVRCTAEREVARL